MFRFTLLGHIGRITPLARDGLRISLAADRLADGPDGKYTRTEWLSAVSFDAELIAKLQADLDVGMNVKLEGRIEPRKREVGGVAIYDASLFIERFERISKPKAAKRPATPRDEAAAASAAA